MKTANVATTMRAAILLMCSVIVLMLARSTRASPVSSVCCNSPLVGLSDSSDQLAHSVYLPIIVNQYWEGSIGKRLFDAERAMAIARPGDIFGVGTKEGLDIAREKLSQIPKEYRMLITPAIAGLEDVLDALDVEIAYIGYDLEVWEATPIEEQLDPVGAVARAREIADARGLKLVLGATANFNRNYGAQMAPYVDYYMPQAKSYQAYLSDEEYEQTLRQLFTTLRAANPDMQLFLDISPSPKDIPQTPEEMLQHVRSLQDMIDGVWITHGFSEQDVVDEFIDLLR